MITLEVTDKRQAAWLDTLVHARRQALDAALMEGVAIEDAERAAMLTAIACSQFIGPDREDMTPFGRAIKQVELSERELATSMRRTNLLRITQGWGSLAVACYYAAIAATVTAHAGAYWGSSVVWFIASGLWLMPSEMVARLFSWRWRKLP